MATRPQIRVVEAANVGPTKRRLRKPQHRFNLVSKPYQIVPFMIAPVLPGETMKNLLMQSRVVTDPIKNALIGWHKEYYFFYVKHRAFTSGRWWTTENAAKLQAMMLDPATVVTTLQASAENTPYYTFNGGMQFVQACYQEVVEEYFRDEDQAYDDFLIGADYAAAQIDTQNWAHSLKAESAGSDDSELPGVDELEELDILPGMTSNYAQWEFMRDHGMTTLTYEDYIRSYGVSIEDTPDLGEEGIEATASNFRPELLRFVRDWKYPTNHVDPATGVPASAVSWSFAERADKDRFFQEPGFIFGVTVTRPKINLGSQKGAAVGFLDNAYAWLPAVLRRHPYVAVKEIADSATVGILENQTEDYWVDVADLFEHGDQFVNHAMSAAANHGIALPTADPALWKYPTEAMVDSLFAADTAENIREDGVVHLTIATSIPKEQTA